MQEVWIVNRAFASCDVASILQCQPHRLVYDAERFLSLISPWAEKYRQSKMQTGDAAHFEAAIKMKTKRNRESCDNEVVNLHNF